MRTAYDSRKDALELGHPTYLGRACKRCGNRERKTETSACNVCPTETYHAKNREKVNSYAKAYYHRTLETRRVARLIQESKRRAKEQGLPHDLTTADIVIPDTCPVLNKPMVSPSLDRKNNALGYVKGNVFVISLEANQKKRDSSIEDLEAILRYMKS